MSAILARLTRGTGPTNAVGLLGLLVALVLLFTALLPGRFATTPRLQVVQKVGLSPRSGVALIEVDGRSFLIVHGEGGTRIRRVSSRAAVMAQSLKEAQS